MSTIIMNLRGARVTPIHRGSLLLSKQEDLCSTSYCFRITLREGRILPLYESLLFEKEYPHSTSHYSPLGIPLLYELLLFEKEEYFHSTSHYSSSFT